jgi:arylsulfatase A-like enzyme
MMTLRKLLTQALYIGFALWAMGSVAVAQEQFVLIVMDDMRPDDLRFMPNLTEYFSTNGKIFNRAFVSCPLCCPSRSTLMTGLYASNHGVTSNKVSLSKKTIFEAIKEQNPNIKTGIIGKYLNSSDGEYRPEFDEWVVFKEGMIYNWSNFSININGTWTNIKQYVSDYFLGQADNFTEKYKLNDFILYLNFTAPHLPAKTPKSFVKNCSEFEPLLPANFDVLDLTAPDKYKHKLARTKSKIEKMICKRARSLAYIDEIIVPFLEKLRAQGTQVLFLSDQGFMLGDYRQFAKNSPYEQVIRSPFLALNMDIAETRLTSFVDVATNLYTKFGITPPYELNGLDFSEDRTEVKVESFIDAGNRIPFVATVTKTEIYVEYSTGETQTIPFAD